MTLDFATIAPYLKDPLVLIGFALFLGFLFARKLISSGIVPPVGAGRGAQIIRLILHYGFLIGVLVILLGFGLKYQELSSHEQRNAIGLIVSELEHNLYVSNELKENTETLYNAAKAVADSIRVQKLQINYGLFPEENINPSLEQNADLYNQRFDWLESSGLLSNELELRRFSQQNAAIKKTIDRTITTVRSLGDRNAARYSISRAAYDANLPVLRKITIVDPQKLANLYAKCFEEREKYFRIADSVEEYFEAMRHYAEASTPERTLLSAALASERLTIRLLLANKENLDRLSTELSLQATAFSRPI